jgi:hypothetical protein
MHRFQRERTQNQHLQGALQNVGAAVISLPSGYLKVMYANTFKLS